ncbi:MAG: ABC transporter permease [Actinomycetota bacterium]|nr:ABC transporter permease [Actinomycetota bacterium]
MTSRTRPKGRRAGLRRAGAIPSSREARPAVRDWARLERLVMAREVRSRITSKTFLVGTAISLVAVIALIVVPSVRNSSAPIEKIGIVGTLSNPLRHAIDTAGSDAGVKVELRPVADVTHAKSDLANGRLVAVLVGDGELIVDRAAAPGSRSTLSGFVSSVAKAVALQAGLERAGIPPQAASALAHPRPIPVVSLKPAPHPAVPLSTALVAMVILFALLQQYGAWILVGVVEEKTTRVVEILLSTLRPRQLLVGKVSGIGVVALVQGGATVAAALVLATALRSSLLAGSGLAFVAVALVWFLLGYAFYCWLFAAAGSLVSRQEDAQNVAFPLMLPLLAGYAGVFAALIPGHASPLVVALGYIPPTAPMVMPTLMALGQVTWWQMGISALTTGVGTVLMAWLASSVYARAVLHTGQRLRWRDVLRRKASGPAAVPGDGIRPAR